MGRITLDKNTLGEATASRMLVAFKNQCERDREVKRRRIFIVTLVAIVCFFLAAALFFCDFCYNVAVAHYGELAKDILAFSCAASAIVLSVKSHELFFFLIDVDTLLKRIENESWK